MQENLELRLSKNEPIVKYHGKWPFTRVFGFQELASSLFSIGNFIPHVLGVLSFRKLVPTHYPYYNMWSIYSLFGMNAWFWSAVFHARDTPTTEVLDYFSAVLLCVVTATMSIIGAFRIRSKAFISMLLFGFLLFYLKHTYHMFFVHFDYGFNMMVGVITSLITSFVWLLWAIFIYNKDTSAKYIMASSPPTYRWRILMVIFTTWIASSMEFFDFPPFFGLIDAHSLWHMLTIPVSYQFYQFLIADALYNVQLDKQRSRKAV